MGFGGERHIAEVDRLVSAQDDLTVSMLSTNDSLEARGRASRALRSDMKLETRIASQLAVVIKSTGAYIAGKLLKTVGDVGTAFGRMSFNTAEAEAALANLSISQKALGFLLVQHFRITGWAASATDRLAESAEALGMNNTRLLLGFTRLIVNILTIVTTFIVLGLMIGAISIAMSGMDSFVIDLTRDMGYLTDAVDGLVMSLSGEGTGNVWDVFLGSLITFGLVAAITSIPVGILAGSLMFIAGIFHLAQDALTPLLGEVGGTGAAFLLAGLSLGPFLAFLTQIPIVGGWVMTALTGLLGLMGSAFGMGMVTWQILLKGFGLVGAGIGLILFAMTNKVEGWKGFMISAFAAVSGAILIHMGLIALGITSIALGPILVIAGLLVLLTKYKDELMDLVGWIGGIFSGGDSSPASDTNSGRAQAYIDMHSSVPAGSISRGYGSRAIGGPVSRGRPYLVGEKGAELFTPNESGNITTNEKLSNMSGGTVNHINIKLDVSGVTDRSDKRALAREISDMLNQEVRRLGGQPTRGRF